MSPRQLRNLLLQAQLTDEGLGGSRWWAESDGFSAAADSIDELLELIRGWAADQNLDDYRMTLVEDTLDDDEAEAADTLPQQITAGGR